MTDPPDDLRSHSSTFNIQHSTFNIQHPTFNIQHPTSNISRPSPALAIMICLWIWQAVAQLLSARSWGHDSFEMTEWLINYAGGFVRRGLPGTMISMAANWTAIQANHLAILTGLACCLLLGAWLLRRATATFPAALVLSCIVMGFPAYQDSIVRKDSMELLFLIGCLTIEGSRLPRPLRIAGLNLLAVAAILSHEAFVFYALAGFILLRRADEPALIWSGLLRRGLALLPAGSCFLLTVMHHGTPAQAEAVNRSWLPLWRTIDPAGPGLETPGAAIQALGWTSEHGLSLAIHLLTSGFYQPAAWAMVFGVSFALVLLFTARNHDTAGTPCMEPRIRVAAILLAQLLFVSPLFVLGVDYGRWLFLWVTSSMILHTMGRRAPGWLEALVGRAFAIARLPGLLARVPARDWYLLFFGVPVCWNLHNFLVASPVSRLCQALRSWF